MVVWVGISRAAKVAHSEPGLRRAEEMVFCFGCYFEGSMAFRTPASELACAPQHEVSRAWSGPNRTDEVGSRGHQVSGPALLITPRPS